MVTVKEIFTVRTEGFEDTAFYKRDEAIDFYLKMKAEYRNTTLTKTTTVIETVTYNENYGVWYP